MATHPTHPSHADPRPDPRREATPIRRAAHYVLALAGWALFVYWWVLVLRRTGSEEMRFSAWFVGLSALVIVLVTVLWVAHNVRIFRERGARSTVRDLRMSYHEDSLGRRVQLEATGALTDAALVRVVVDDGRKRYLVTPVGMDERLPGAESRGSS